MCDLLTEDQIIAFDLPRNARTHKVADVHVDCQREKQGGERWQVDYGLFLNVDLVGEWYDMPDDLRKDGLELRYIEGQPAVVDESEDSWFCNVAVRLAERKSLQVMGTDSRREDSCPQVISVAEQIVRNLAGEG